MELAAAQAAWLARNNTRRLWSKDATLWTGRDEASWLGWLDVIDSELRALEPLQDFAQELRAQKFTDVLLLGMGGSSLGPEVLAKSLGSAPGYPALHVLDSTDPEQVRRFEASVDIARTLFIVASKSGTHARAERADGLFFCARVRRRRERGRHAFRRHHRSGLASAKDRRGKRLSPHLPRHSQHRRPLFRSVEIRPGPAGGDRTGRGRFPARRARDGAGVRFRQQPCR